ncbi:hypothetical protein FPFC_070340 [Fructobacillus pseudoficulneus]|uniref:Uncharacterized protein n=1 Tax=Fructobacillus pseudoficulneus TaxID=220714 RepID=A0A3F3H556_9LACO|nr:hypothetical protein [Fructobacillus pseudoficulneus]GAP03418.1 hypothetical protein FPFC_070340 [Fructobacillus pseudoficulneus]SEH46418.1 hypothetical protein SAMN05660469_1379 [Fructobacillus pseudoficulneus]
MSLNRVFHIVMALVWLYTIYVLANMQDMLAMYVMAGGMFAQAVFSAIFNDKSC